ncbi:hypothetical protein PPSIR1_24489 [Plesiocystis pacifica SIR-1]|uniref:eCIS core domain-containing protein n=1 Tax=Plesiocystis pacifica SIR-1 TaxID=391625 RepID=A6GGV4_9BACT|nr:hypothetical protein PPSIR1_24489 [Plesiocystis pacifica SIR-1]
MLQAVSDQSAHVSHLRGLQELADRSARSASLPSSLSRNLERLSGQPMGDVRVHYGSTAPSRVGAHAFTQGSDIHLGPRQERHLAHEAWHAVQQKQGRVAATGEVGGHALNSDSSLEREADVMGARAARGGFASGAERGPSFQSRSSTSPSSSSPSSSPAPVQRVAYDANDSVWKSHIKEGREMAPGQGYIRIVSRKGSWALSGNDHTWVCLEGVDPGGTQSETVVTDLSHSKVSINRNAANHVRALSSSTGNYVGSNYTITWQGVQGALTKAAQIKADYDEKWDNPTTGAWEDNPNRSYTYDETGRKMFKRARYINCARYAAKMLKASGVGNKFTRRRAGYVVMTPRGISLGLGRTWKQSAKTNARSAGRTAKAKVSEGIDKLKGMMPSWGTTQTQTQTQTQTPFESATEEDIDNMVDELAAGNGTDETVGTDVLEEDEELPRQSSQHL